MWGDGDQLEGSEGKDFGEYELIHKYIRYGSDEMSTIECIEILASQLR